MRRHGARPRLASSTMRFSLLFGLAALLAAPASAQEQPPPDAPTATARTVNTPPPAQTASPPTVKPTASPPVEPSKAEAPPLKPQQLFISPMGEPFRSAPGTAYPVNQWFQKADADADGAITLEEFKADALRFFKVLDVNGDGIIDGFEAQDYEAKIAPEILPQVTDVLSARDVMTQHELAESGHRKRRPEDAIGGPAGGRGAKTAASRDAMSGASIYGLLADPEPVRSADVKLDYHITQAEWLAAATRRFQELDKEHAGKLTLAKLPQTPLQKAIEDNRKADAKGKR